MGALGVLAIVATAGSGLAWGSTLAPVLSALSVAPAPRSAAPHSSQGLLGELQREVNAAIDRGSAWLGSRSLAVHGHPGLRWLELYTLAKCGAFPAALARLPERDPTDTYAMSCALLGLVALGGRERAGGEASAARIERIAMRLLAAQNRTGCFGYPAGEDLSNTQYAALGLHAAARGGVVLPTELWRNLAYGVLAYQNEDGGFGYTSSSSSTGSMTAAGVGTLAICIAGAGSRGELGAELEERARLAIQTGTAWLAREFAVDENPGAGAGWHYYWLYGLERCGALTAQAKIGEHDWYLEGARQIVGDQREDGSWEGDAITTCFALLFLRRATHATSPGWTGTATIGVQSTRDPDAAVVLSASGDTPLALWIEHFGQRELAELAWPGEQGLRVRAVTYLANGEPIGSVGGEPARASDAQRFPLRHRFQEPGRYELVAVATVLEPPVALADEAGSRRYVARIRELRSPVLEVVIRDVDPAWSRALRAELGKRPAAVVRCTASSTYEGWDPRSFTRSLRAVADFAVDGDPETFWLAAPGDEDPSLVLRFDDFVVERIVLAHARLREGDADDFARAARARLICGDEEHVVPLGPGLRQPTLFELPEARRLSRLRIVLEGRVPGRRIDTIGLAEVSVQGSAPARR